METVEGGCHCGKVRFRVQFDDRYVLKCNCSICRMSGYLHLIVTRDAFQLLRGSDVLNRYQFNQRIAQHTFCKICGVKSFYIPRSHPDGISVNARCLDDLEARDFTIREFDGARWEENIDSIRSGEPLK